MPEHPGTREREDPEVPFRPFPLLRHPHLQTLVAAKLSWPRAAPATTRHVELEDGDTLALRVSTPEGWRDSDPTVVLVHGLCGCSRSPYMVRLARRLDHAGVRAVRMNLRGCGEGEGLARQMYHSGRSEDLRAVLEELRRSEPRSRMTVIGFSLGGNIVLKLAGELGPGGPEWLDAAMAVCPPVDLLASSRRLSSPSGAPYEKYFCRLLHASARARHRRFPDLPPLNLPKRYNLYEFDDRYTAPQCGFASADDYYARASSLPLLASITTRCHILYAADDPLIDVTALDVHPLPPTIRTTRTHRGGHLGFLGRPWTNSGYHWMDNLLMAWLRDTVRP